MKAEDGTYYFKFLTQAIYRYGTGMLIGSGLLGLGLSNSFSGHALSSACFVGAGVLLFLLGAVIISRAARLTRNALNAEHEYERAIGGEKPIGANSALCRVCNGAREVAVAKLPCEHCNATGVAPATWAFWNILRSKANKENNQGPV